VRDKDIAVIKFDKVTGACPLADEQFHSAARDVGHHTDIL
jgi:hypothetical protein